MKANSNRGELIFEKLLKALNQNAEAVIELFHPEAIIEFPYASSLGTVSRMNFTDWGKYLKGVLPSMPDIHFENARVYKVNENTYWAEVHGESRVPHTGKMYVQDWVIYYTLKEGKITYYKEYWDPSAVVKAFGGAKKMDEIFNTDEQS